MNEDRWKTISFCVLHLQDPCACFYRLLYKELGLKLLENNDLAIGSCVSFNRLLNTVYSGSLPLPCHSRNPSEEEEEVVPVRRPPI
jgi:hypothetical protein